MTRLGRLRAMDREELRFRLESETRRVVGRLRHAVAPARWRRASLGSLVEASVSAHVAEARDAARRGDFLRAHRALAEHFSRRRSVWPIKAPNQARLRDAVRSRFPNAVKDAARAADLLIQGRHDLLGYRDVDTAWPPDWHRDPVHGARAPKTFWSTVPYLDPSHGDHKVIWELNRHQHWRKLGRAFWLTEDVRYRDAFVRELETWIETNPPETGINWASALELACRSLAWTWATEFFSAGAASDSTPWLVDLLVALDRQLTHVEHNLSYYFSPNTHLTGEALGLYAVSLAFPELRRSGARGQLGRRILLRELERQIGTDGGHAELSAHYHRYSTDFYLLALMLARSSADPYVDRFDAAARAQAAYLRTLADDRGRLPLIGDDDGGQLFGICDSRPSDASSTLAAAASLFSDARLALAPPSEEVFWILGESPAVDVAETSAGDWSSRFLSSTGYFVSRTRTGDHLIFDAGPHGFLNGGHAHSDALSIVLTVAGDELLIDPGTATYTMDPSVRDRFRSTRMHNTVVIDGRDHARPRGPFHWHEHPSARMLSTKIVQGWDFAQATHDAYGIGVHIRSILALHGLGWIVVDQILGQGRMSACSWWHLHPKWRAANQTRSVSLISGRRQLTMAFTSDSVSTLYGTAFAEFAPEYGRVEAAPTICVTDARPAPFAMGTFIPAHGSPLKAGRIAELPLVKELTDGWVGSAFEISTDRDLLTVLVASPRHVHPVSGPAVTWGTSAVETDARALVVRHYDTRFEELAVVDGRSLRVAHPLASAVHADDRASAAVRAASTKG